MDLRAEPEISDHPTMLEVVSRSTLLAIYGACAARIMRPRGPMACELLAKYDWKYGTTREVLIRAFLHGVYPGPVIIKFYRHWWWPWSKSLGGYKNGVIKVRKKRFLALTDLKRIGFICHELCHHLGFGHGDNTKTEDKCKYSVPYYVSENIGRWL